MATTAQTGTVTIKQSSNSVYVSTLTITRNGQAYSLASTNNQIICCDCNRFYSIHAPACPFCGCPISYAAEFYFNKYDPEIMRQQQLQQSAQQQEEQRRIKREEKKAERLSIIDEIASYRYSDLLSKIRLKTRLEHKSKAVLKKAAQRAARLNELKAPIPMTEESYAELICSDEKYFENAFRRATYVKSNREELPVIGQKEWELLLSLDDSDFDFRISILKIMHQTAQEKAAKEAQKRKEEAARKQEAEFNKMCGRYHIDDDQLASMIRKYGSKESVLERLHIIDNIGGDARHKINLLSYIDTPEALKELVKTLR